jgi:hypothetical protein
VKHNTSVALLALFAAAAAHADTTIGVITDRGWQPMRGSINVGAPVTTEAACWTALRAWAEANRTRIATPKCRNEKVAAGIEYVARRTRRAALRDDRRIHARRRRTMTTTRQPSFE